MSNKNLSIELRSRTDKNGQIFFVGKLRAPVQIDCSEGVVFLIYVSEANAEEMQIAPMDQKNDND